MTATWPRRRAPWVLAGALLVLLLVLLVVAGYSSAQVGIDAHAHTPVAADKVPPGVLDGGPIVDATGPAVRGTRLPAHTVALTFDDGPDPTWTPKVLAVLRKYHVPGTFFVVGSMVVRHPELIRRIRDSGSEVGVHTFTHPDLIDVSPWRLDKELTVTQFALAGSAGISSYLLRPPYSAAVSDVDNPEYGTVLAAGRRGYLTAFTDVDSEDWRRPGVPAIIRNATPAAGQGAVILMHDAGGDRSQTVAALNRLIPRLRADGYRFATVTGAVGLPPLNPPAGARDRLVGRILLGTTGLALGVVSFVQWGMLAIGVLVILRFIVMVVVARRHRRRGHDPSWRWGPPVVDPVSVIVPTFNERTDVEATLRSVLANDHPLEVIVVDDGSTDGTADLVASLDLPRVRLVRQANAGKASALNRGIALARNDIIVMMDGDTIFQPDTVGVMVQPFADPAVGAVAGNVKIANRNTLLGRLQHIEYVIGFNVDRRVYDLLGAMPTVPGAGGAFRRAALVDVGGLSDDTIAEDTDLTIAIGRAGWRVVYEDNATSWTEAPSTVRQLARQRYRWTYGTMQAVWKHRAAIRQRGASGRIGRWGLVHVAVFQMLLPLSAPLVDVYLCYGLLFLDAARTVLVWAAVLGIQLVGATVALHWDGEPRSQAWIMPLQQVVYRQLMYVVLFQSALSALAGTRVRWHKLRRTGGLDVLLRDLRRNSTTGDASGAAAAKPTRATTPPPGAVAVTTQRKPAGGAERERWPDLLRALALGRVMVYHVFGSGWLTLLFPSMGMLFALGGSLMVRSTQGSPLIDVIGRRLRRVLPPVWLLGALLIPVMFWHGWAHETGDTALQPEQLLLWVFPIADPPGSAWATDATVVLWYIRTYLWFVLLTPVLLRAFRSRPLIAVSVPLAVLAGNELFGEPLSNWGQAGPVVLDLATFATCWLLGFAHRDGTLARTRPLTVAVLAIAALGIGGVWTASHPAPGSGFDLNDIPVGQALISVGAVLILLRLNPKLTVLTRLPALSALVRVINARAITIYLWHNIAIDAAVPIQTWLGSNSEYAQLGISVVLTAVAVLAFGWVEDVAAHRKLQLIPRPVRVPA